MSQQWTEEELRTMKIKVSPIVTYGDLETVDRILTDGNISWEGEQIRQQLFKAGFRIVKIDA